MAERSGIIIFTLWYIAIAYNYYMERRRKDDEGTQTHTPESISSVGVNEPNFIPDYDLNEVEMILQTAVNKVANVQPTCELKSEISPEINSEVEEDLDPEPPEDSPEPKSNVDELSCHSEFVKIGDVSKEAANSDSFNYEGVAEEEEQ